jgi:hypothetical protein
VPRVTRATWGPRARDLARDGTESSYGSGRFAVRVGLGWDSEWDCARGISPPRESFTGPHFNSRAKVE